MMLYQMQYAQKLISISSCAELQCLMLGKTHGDYVPSLLLLLSPSELLPGRAKQYADTVLQLIDA
jgi:hypothetical protein